VNENLKTGPQGLRLLMDFEKGPDDGSVPLSENGAALSPYVCPGDELTAGFGCCTWFDGEPVQIHHRLETEADAINLLMQNLVGYEDCVRGALTREATQHQFDGMVCLCFNIGKSAFLGSSVLKSFNAGRMEDAAAAFGLWTGSTTARPRKKQIADPEYAPKLKQDHKGLWRWIGPEGQYCAYMLRLLGLLDRHYAEALLFMSRNWTGTLRSPTAMELKLEPTLPSEADWDAGKGRWIDKVRYRTPFKDVYAKAYDDRLDSPEPAHSDQPIPAPQEQVAPKSSPAATGDSGALVLTKDMQQPAGPSAAAPKVDQPSPATQPATAGLPPSNTDASKSASPAPPVGQLPPLTPPAGAQASTVPRPGPKPPGPPSPIPPSVQVNTGSDMGPTTKTMWVSKRFWGGVLIIAGRLIIVADIGGHFAPAVRSFIGDGVLMDWMTGVIVTMIGEAVLARGEKKATGPIDTPKRIALTTPAP